MKFWGNSYKNQHTARLHASEESYLNYKCIRMSSNQLNIHYIAYLKILWFNRYQNCTDNVQFLKQTPKLYAKMCLEIKEKI